MTGHAIHSWSVSAVEDVGEFVTDILGEEAIRDIEEII